TDVIEIGIAVDIVEVSALAAGDEDRLAADAAEGPCRAVDAAGNDATGLLERLCTPRTVTLHDPPFFSPLPAGERGRGGGVAMQTPSPPTPLPSGERGENVSAGSLLAAPLLDLVVEGVDRFELFVDLEVRLLIVEGKEF